MGEGGREKTHLETVKVVFWGSSLAADSQPLNHFTL